LRLIIFGPQGAGKGTQSARIAEKYGIPSISTGEIFRWAIKGGTALGLKVAEYVEHGRLVPDELTISVVKERLSTEEDGWILDGYPRNVEQADQLESFLAEQGKKVDAALVIEVDEEVSIRRITGRLVCSNCGRNYHIDAPPDENWTCNTCGGAVIKRTDDVDEEAVRERLKLYHEQTEPLKTYFASKRLLRTVSGVGTVDEVFDRIIVAL
jgi:adenylate kinase